MNEGTLVLIAILAVIVVVAIIVIVLSSGEQKQASKQFEASPASLPTAKVRHVIDGDTVIVSRSWRNTRIRLDAIDCPENGQHWGNIAKAGLIKLIGGRNVRLENHGLDRHGRTLATLYVRHRSEWINVNERMVMLGHAWVMRKYYDHLPWKRQHQLNRLERWARSKRVGLWKTSNPIPPWKWRNQG